jgi:hypothetical protein
MVRTAKSLVASRVPGVLPKEFLFHAQTRKLRKTPAITRLCSTVSQVQLEDEQIQQCDEILKFAQDREEDWTTYNIANSDARFFLVTTPVHKHQCLSILSSIYVDQANRTPNIFINKIIPSVSTFISKSVGMRTNKGTDKDDRSIVSVVVGLSSEFVGGSLVVARKDNFIMQTRKSTNDFNLSSTSAKSRVSIKMRRGTAAILYNQPEHMVTKVNVGSLYTLIAVYE